MDEQNQVLEKLVKEYFTADTLRCVLSDPLEGSEYRKVNIKPIKSGYQAEQFTKTQTFHKNMSAEETIAYIETAMNGSFKQYTSWSLEWECSIGISKKGQILHKRCKNKTNIEVSGEHNRVKDYIIKEGECIQPLIDAGIFTKDGRVINSMRDKFRQINRFIELVDDNMSLERFAKKKQITVLDFGCGKSYLTFLLYYYFTAVKGFSVRMIGVDLKESVLEECRKAAERYGYEGLEFIARDIKDFRFEDTLDIMISLHACDTATDFALYNALRWKAEMILSVPCCQHEINSQLEKNSLLPMTGYGVIKERMGALITDSIRGDLLRYCGYKTQILEFVELEHTPKNLLIRAVRTGKTDLKALETVEKLMADLDIKPTLYNLLIENQ